MSDEIPKQDLLAKLLRMSTSPNDGEALTAIRKANALLKDNGWDWDKLLQGKIRIAADPFSNLATPGTPSSMGRPAPPPRPQPAYRPQPAPQPPRPQAPPQQPKPQKPWEPWSHQSTQGQNNAFPGNCWCCGHSVDARAGKLFIPQQFNRKVRDDRKKVICNSCDNDRYAFIDVRPAPQPKAPHVGTPNLGDL